MTFLRELLFDMRDGHLLGVDCDEQRGEPCNIRRPRHHNEDCRGVLSRDCLGELVAFVGMDRAEPMIDAKLNTTFLCGNCVPSATA